MGEQGYPQPFIDLMFLVDAVTSMGPLMRHASANNVKVPGAVLASYGHFAGGGEWHQAARPGNKVGLLASATGMQAGDWPDTQSALMTVS